MANDLIFGGATMGEIYYGSTPIVAAFKGNEEVWRAIGAPYREDLVIANSTGTTPITKDVTLYRGVYSVVMISGGGAGWSEKQGNNYNYATTGGGGSAIVGTLRITQGGTYRIVVGNRGGNNGNYEQTGKSGGDTSLSFNGNTILLCGGGKAATGSGAAGVGGKASATISGLTLMNGKSGSVGGGSKEWQGTNTAPDSVLFDTFGNTYGWAGVTTFDRSDAKNPTGGYFSLEYVAPITE